MASFIAKLGIRHVFVIQGGAVAHLIDSVGNHPELMYVAPAHEQAAAMAVDGYARVSRNMGCAMATTGPGVVNLLTGVACLYYDSLPGLFIAGQVSTFRLRDRVPGVRQLGFQESPHVELMRPFTNYATLVTDPLRIRYELEKAVHLATTGRPGPVFIDICDDVQRADIDPPSLESFVPEHAIRVIPSDLDGKIDAVIAGLAKAERPVVVLGAALKITNCEKQALAIVRALKLPFALTWAMADTVASDDPLFVGTFGISASRRGNFALQNSDYVLSIGSRLDTHATGTPLNTFARAAQKVIVDIDASELDKFDRQQLPGFVAVKADVRDFLAGFERKRNTVHLGDLKPWYDRIGSWRTNFPAVLPKWEKQNGSVNPYVFLDKLSNHTSDDEIVVPDCGSNLIQTFQAYRIREGQKVFSAFNNSPMGYSLAACIGACFANDRKPVVCIIGDGGLQVNMQELGTVTRYKLPIRIFLFNNHGYGIIQQTQDDWLDGRYHASTPETGLMDPDYVAIAKAFGIEALTVSEHRDLDRTIERVLGHDGPILCNIEIRPDQRIVPMLKAGRAIEDTKPLLDRKVFRENMIVPPLESSN